MDNNEDNKGKAKKNGFVLLRQVFGQHEIHPAPRDRLIPIDNIDDAVDRIRYNPSDLEPSRIESRTKLVLKEVTGAEIIHVAETVTEVRQKIEQEQERLKMLEKRPARHPHGRTFSRR